MNDPTMLPDTLEATVEWFDRARTDKPTRKDFHVQLGVHFEEVSEMAAELTGHNGTVRELIEKVKLYTHQLGMYLKQDHDCVTIEKENEEGYLDAICDQLVTAAGCAQASEMDVVGALDCVNRSNFSKFVDGKAIFDENGKIAKGPNYFKADLKPFLNR